MPHLAMVLALVGSLVAPSLMFTPLEPQTPQRATDRRTRDIYVSVLDDDGKPVTGLTADDFVVREQGAAREVLKAGPATEPLTIALTVDDSQAATSIIQFLREGLTRFVKKLDGKAEIAFSTIGERPTAVVEYTNSTAQLEKAINRLFARPGAGAYLLEGLVELSRGLERRESPRKTIVVVTIENGAEFSNQYYQPVLDALKRSGATLHVLAFGLPSPSLSDEMRNRNMVIAEGTSLTGGRRDQVLAESGLPDRLAQTADELLNQYVVTYSRPETLIPAEKIEVTVKKTGYTVRAPKRVAGS
jgi:Ca-activated chloride channel family protein